MEEILRRTRDILDVIDEISCPAVSLDFRYWWPVHKAFVKRELALAEEKTKMVEKECETKISEIGLHNRMSSMLHHHHLKSTNSDSEEKKRKNNTR